MHIDDKLLALVTGASRGIGAALAEALAVDGWHVLMTARTEGALAEIEERIHGRGGTATIAPLDLLDEAGVDRLGAAVGARWGRLDALVLNAATLGTLGPVPHADPAEFARVMAVNVTAPWRLLRACDPWLRFAKGQVVALTSSVAISPRAYWGPYAASKAALATLIRTYGEEVSAMGVVTHIVDPGGTRTAMRARAYPGEDPAGLKGPEVVAARISALLREGAVGRGPAVSPPSIAPA